MSIKKLVNQSDNARVTLDRYSININFHTYNPLKGKRVKDSRGFYFLLQLQNGTQVKVYVKGTQGRTDLHVYMLFNGYELIRQHLQNTAGIDFSKYKATVANHLNFIPIEILLNHSDIQWRRICRSEVQKSTLSILEMTRVDIESQLKSLFTDTNIQFDGYSLYSAEVALDIISPTGCNFAELKQVKTALIPFTKYVVDSEFTSDDGDRAFTDTVKTLEGGSDRGTSCIRGKLSSDIEFQFYVKEKTKSDFGLQHSGQMLNRLELKIRQSKYIKKITSDKANSFFDLEKFTIYSEDLMNYWFDFIYNSLGIAYNTDDDEMIVKMMKERIAEAHPKNSYFIVRDLFEIGKLSIKASYATEAKVRLMEKQGLLYKPDKSKSGRCFYALHPNFKKSVINTIKGNRHAPK